MLALALLACSSPPPPAPPPPKPPEVVEAPPPQPRPLPENYKAPPIAAFGTAEIWRRGPEESSTTYDRIEVRVAWPSSAEAPVVGAAITLVPVAALPPVELSITAAKKETEPEIGDFWEITLAPLTDPRYLSAPAAEGRRPEFPFDAVFLSPVEPRAKLLTVAMQPLGDLPPDATHAEVLAAVDVSGDDRPDAVALSFCCAEERALHRTLSECDYHCGEVWLLREGDWVKIESSQPM